MLVCLQKMKFLKVTGTSKGKGFPGVMKRHNFQGFKATHGVHESYRGPGSIGQCATPAEFSKEKNFRDIRVLIKFLFLTVKVVKIDVEKNLVM